MTIITNEIATKQFEKDTSDFWGENKLYVVAWNLFCNMFVNNNNLQLITSTWQESESLWNLTSIQNFIAKDDDIFLTSLNQIMVQMKQWSYDGMIAPSFLQQNHRQSEKMAKATPTSMVSNFFLLLIFLHSSSSK